MIYSQDKEIEGLVNKLYCYASMDLRIPLNYFPDFLYLDSSNNDLFMEKVSSCKPDFAKKISNLECQISFFKGLYSKGIIGELGKNYDELIKMKNAFKGSVPYYNIDYNIILVPKNSENLGGIIGEEMFHFFNFYFSKKAENSIDQEFIGFMGRNLIRYFLDFHFDKSYNHLFKEHSRVSQNIIISPKDDIEEEYNNHVKGYFKASNFMKKFNHDYASLFFKIIKNPKFFFGSPSDEIIKKF